MTFVKGKNNETLWLSREEKEKSDDELREFPVGWATYITEHGKKLKQTPATEVKGNQIL